MKNTLITSYFLFFVISARILNSQQLQSTVLSCVHAAALGIWKFVSTHMSVCGITDQSPPGDIININTHRFYFPVPSNYSYSFSLISKVHFPC